MAGAQCGLGATRVTPASSGGCTLGPRHAAGVIAGLLAVVALAVAVVLPPLIPGQNVPKMRASDARYVDQRHAFSIDLEPGFRVAGPSRPAATGPGGFERPDFMVAYVRTPGPTIDGGGADVIDVKVVDLGRPIPVDDQRLRDLPALLDATLRSRGDHNVHPVDVSMVAGAASCAREFTDPRGRHGISCMVVGGSHLYTIDALVTQRTRSRVWPSLVKTLQSFRIRPVATAPSPPRTFVDDASGLSLTCDRRFMRLTVTRDCWAADAIFVIVDPLSGVAANGRFNDGLVVYTAALPGSPTSAQRRRFAAQVQADLRECGMSPTCPRRALEINGLAGYRFASRCADGGRDLLYVLFSGDRAYFIEGCARASTWAVDRRLFEAAMRSVVVVDPREGTTVSASSGAQRAA